MKKVVDEISAKLVPANWSYAPKPCENYFLLCGELSRFVFSGKRMP
jgi:hypothetical protein